VICITQYMVQIRVSDLFSKIGFGVIVCSLSASLAVLPLVIGITLTATQASHPPVIDTIELLP
jgi:hypothetical protein